MAAGSGSSVVRTYEEEMQFIEQHSAVEWHIKMGMVPNMRVPGKFYVNEHLKQLVFDELHAATKRADQGGFSPAIKQICNVAGLPGIVKVSSPLESNRTNCCSCGYRQDATIPHSCLHHSITTPACTYGYDVHACSVMCLQSCLICNVASFSTILHLHPLRPMLDNENSELKACSICHLALRSWWQHTRSGIGIQESIALPDVHSGYGFAIGNVAAFDMDDPEAVVSPGGVGFDINCGVRLIRTNLVSVVFRLAWNCIL